MCNSDQQLKNPSSLKSRFTTRFVRALTKINSQKAMISKSSSPLEIFQRYRRIKVAADKSMAYSVGSRRTWSRAMIWKLRSRTSLRRRLASSSGGRSVKTRTTSPHQAAIAKNKSREKENKTRTTTATSGEDDQVGFVAEADELRELVPGGKAMDLCNLLDETAHYIKCLTTQVQVMRKIVGFYSV